MAKSHWLPPSQILSVSGESLGLQILTKHRLHVPLQDSDTFSFTDMLELPLILQPFLQFSVLNS